MPGMSEIPITVRGDVDRRAVEQLERCAQAGDALAGALCADGHVGYSQPIGGVVAYPDHISPSGVGYDIACLAAGERVLTADGCHVAIEDLAGTALRPVRPGADGSLAPIAPYVGVVARGTRPVLRLTLADGRSVRLTADHRVRTARGWLRADELSTRDAVLCPALTGLPFEPCPLSAGFLRLAGYVTGAGHIPGNARYASVYTSILGDVGRLSSDVATETGDYDPPAYVRTRPNGSTEVNVRINNRELVRR